MISTPYWHAAELLRDNRGVLVPFGDPAAIARAVSELLHDGTRRNVMSDNAYKLGREMVWSNTAGLYMRSFELAPTARERRPTQIRCRQRLSATAGAESGINFAANRFGGDFPVRCRG